MIETLLSNKNIFLVAFLSGLATILIAISLQYLIGSIYSQKEAQILFQETLNSTRYLASSSMGAGSTVLALMLTLLSMGNRLDKDFEKKFYQKIKLIALLAVVEIIVSSLSLQINTMPISQLDLTRTSINFKYFYYFAVSLSVLLAGIATSMTILLVNSIFELISVIQNKPR